MIMYKCQVRPLRKEIYLYQINRKRKKVCVWARRPGCCIKYLFVSLLLRLLKIIDISVYCL
jgi:hypothetical protein